MNGNNNNNQDFVNGIDMRLPLAELRAAVRQRGGVLANNAGIVRIRRVAAALIPAHERGAHDAWRRRGGPGGPAPRAVRASQRGRGRSGSAGARGSSSLSHPRINNVETDLWEKLHYVSREQLLPLGRRLYVLTQVGERRGAEWRARELKEALEGFERYYRLISAALDHGARVAIHLEPGRTDYNQAVKDARKRSKIDEEEQEKKRSKLVCRFCLQPGHFERFCPNRPAAAGGSGASGGGGFRGNRPRGGASGGSGGAAPSGAPAK